MKITQATIKKLEKLNYSKLAKDISKSLSREVSRQQIRSWIDYGSIPDDYVLAINDVIGFKLCGKWSDRPRSVCGDCGCIKICSK